MDVMRGSWRATGIIIIIHVEYNLHVSMFNVTQNSRDLG